MMKEDITEKLEPVSIIVTGLLLTFVEFTADVRIHCRRKMEETTLG
jgi:hypothetical protein